MFDIISSSIIVLIHHTLHEENENIKLILNEISEKTLQTMPNTLPSFTGKTLTLYERQCIGSR